VTTTTATRATPIDRIVTVTGDYFYVCREDLLAPGKVRRRIAFARQVCMYLARKRTRMSLEEIGEALGGRHHCTVIHGVRVIENAKAFQDLVSRQVGEIEERLDQR
jgi:chromosomal replication initiator protein